MLLDQSPTCDNYVLQNSKILVVLKGIDVRATKPECKRTASVIAPFLHSLDMQIEFTAYMQVAKTPCFGFM